MMVTLYPHHQTITSLRESCERHETLEQDYTSLEVEYSRVTKMLSNMKETVAKVGNVPV